MFSQLKIHLMLWCSRRSVILSSHANSSKANMIWHQCPEELLLSNANNYDKWKLTEIFRLENPCCEQNQNFIIKRLMPRLHCAKNYHSNLSPIFALIKFRISRGLFWVYDDCGWNELDATLAQTFEGQQVLKSMNFCAFQKAEWLPFQILLAILDVFMLFSFYIEDYAVKSCVINYK